MTKEVIQTHFHQFGISRNIKRFPTSQINLKITFADMAGYIPDKLVVAK